MRMARVCGAQVIVEITRRGALASLLLFLHPWDSDADGEAAEHAQNMSGFGGAHPAAVFVESIIQPVVEHAFDAPVLAFQGLQPFRGESLQRAAADQMHGRGALFAIAPDTALQSGDVCGGRKADGLGRRLLAFERADFPAAPVTLPPAGSRLRGGSRGKKAAL